MFSTYTFYQSYRQLQTNIRFERFVHNIKQVNIGIIITY